MAVGDAEGADAAYARHIHASTRRSAAAAGGRRDDPKRHPEGRALLKAHLHDRRRPTCPPSACSPRSPCAWVATTMHASCSSAASSWRRRFTAARYQLRAAAASEQRRRARPWPRSSACWRPIRATRAIATCSAVILSHDRRVRPALADIYAELLREYPAQRQGLAELRPRAEDRRPPGRRHRRLPP